MGSVGLGACVGGLQGFDSNSISVNILSTVLRLLRQIIMLLCFFDNLYFVFNTNDEGKGNNTKNTGHLIVSLMPFAQCFVIIVFIRLLCYLIENSFSIK